MSSLLLQFSLRDTKLISIPFWFFSWPELENCPVEFGTCHWFLLPLCQYEGTNIYVVTILNYAPFDSYIYPSILELQLLTDVDPTAAQILISRTMPYLEYNIPVYGEYVFWWTLYHLYPVGYTEIALSVAHIFLWSPFPYFFNIFFREPKKHS